MSQPTTYVRAFNFSNQQAVAPSDPLPADKLDLELNLVKTSLDETQANLKLIQRDDGAIKNQTVGYDQLKAELKGFGFNPPEPWATETNYIARDTIFEDAGFYSCVTSHISGVFADDLAAGKWLLIADFTAAASESAASAAAALASENASAASAADAAASEAAAASSATSADADALSAAADRVQTGLDRAATAVDVISAEAHKVQTGLDRVATAADRVQTGIDAAAAAASAASVDVTSMDWRPSLMVNGSFIDSQENGNTLGTASGYFAADQFAMYFTAATAAMSIQRVQSSKSLAGSANKLEYKCTTAKASLGASDFVMISQPIEGSRPDFVAAGWGAAGAKQFVYRHEMSLSAGLYHLHVQNSAGNRHIAVPFTVAGGDANLAKVHEIVVPGDTAGTWLTADGVIGAVFDVVLAAGSSRTGGTASTWGATTYYAASTQFNILSSTANVARLADVGLKLDPDATGIYGAYEVGEVDAVYRSERYWGSYSGQNTIGSGVIFSATSALIVVRFPRMCKAPSLGTLGAPNFRIIDAVARTPSTVAAAVAGVDSFELDFTITGGTAGQGAIFRMNAGGNLLRNARLS